VTYEWDEAKRAANLRKHGYDFIAADLVYASPRKLTIQMIRRGKSRLQDIAIVEIRGAILTLVYLIRGYNIRIISFRKASRKEPRIYDSSRAQRHD
jgi:uncharacterized protein